MYTYHQVDFQTFVVVKDETFEICVCSEFEKQDEEPEKRAKLICDSLNLMEKAKFSVFDVSEDYEDMTFGVNLNDLSDDDFHGITAWKELGDAVGELDELNNRGVAGAWEVFALVPVEHKITARLIDEFMEG